MTKWKRAAVITALTAASALAGYKLYQKHKFKNAEIKIYPHERVPAELLAMRFDVEPSKKLTKWTQTSTFDPVLENEKMRLREELQILKSRHGGTDVYYDPEDYSKFTRA